MSDVQITRRCPSCGASIRRKGSFCTQCGAPIVAAPVAKGRGSTKALKKAEKRAESERLTSLAEVASNPSMDVVALKPGDVAVENPEEPAKAAPDAIPEMSSAKAAEEKPEAALASAIADVFGPKQVAETTELKKEAVPVVGPVETTAPKLVAPPVDVASEKVKAISEPVPVAPPVVPVRPLESKKQIVGAAPLKNTPLVDPPLDVHASTTPRSVASGVAVDSSVRFLVVTLSLFAVFLVLLIVSQVMR